MRQLAGIFIMMLLAMGMRFSSAEAAPAMIFFNGGMGAASALTSSQINGVRASGMTTMVIFNMGVDTNGNFNFAGIICSNGVYLGPSNWGALLTLCRAQPSSVNRIEICIGGWGDPSWSNIKNRIATDGTNNNTVLYENLVALKNALHLDAIDNDDESTYDSASTIKFGQMCASVGLKSTLCPYTNPGYWQAVKAGLGTNCDEVYLQCYDGGAGNNPAAWNTYFGGLKVIAGYWDYERDTTFVTNMLAWKSGGAAGGFLWPSCTGCDPPADADEMAQYGTWIQDVFNSVVLPTTAHSMIGGQVTFTASGFVGNGFAYQWEIIQSGQTNIIPNATNLSLTLSNLQLTNTGIYQLRATNSAGVQWSSTSSLTISGVPGAVNNVVTHEASQTGLTYGFDFTPSWQVSSGSLIAGMMPSAVGTGDFSDPYANECGTVAVLTDGSVGTFLELPGDGGSLTEIVAGSGAGQSVTYTLTTSSFGYNLTNITVFGGWGDAGRDGQAYTVYYSTASAPASFIRLGAVSFNPINAAGNESATYVTLTPANGYLATNVVALKFDFTTPAPENGYTGYSEIGVYGVSIVPKVVSETLPVTAVDVVGSSVVFTAGVTGDSLSYQWQKISGDVTNDIAGATNALLTLNSLQLTDTASYQLLATNVYGAATSTPSVLVVNTVPSPVNNLITCYAAQTGLGETNQSFYPTWALLPGSLIAGLAPSAVGTGDFSDPFANECGTVAVLTDGSIGYFEHVIGNGGSPTEVVCGPNAGQSITYTLPASTYGYDLTNITVYGGWGDSGRDQQAYTIYYSQVSSPNNFLVLSSVNYNPTDSLAAQSATRATLTAASGFIATNVASVKFDFTNPQPENGYTGYGEIQLFGDAVLPPSQSTSLGVVTPAGNGNVLVMTIGNLVVGRTYELQSTTNLMSGAWVTEANFTATTDSMAVTNSVTGYGQKFYRVVSN